MYPITHNRLCIFSSFLASLSCVISSFISLSPQLVVLLTHGVSSAGRPSGLVQVEAGRADPPGRLAKGAGVQAAAAGPRRADLCAHQEPGRTKASVKGPPPLCLAAKGRKQGPSAAVIPWNDPLAPAASAPGGSAVSSPLVGTVPADLWLLLLRSSCSNNLTPPAFYLSRLPQNSQPTDTFPEFLHLCIFLLFKTVFSVLSVELPQEGQSCLGHTCGNNLVTSCQGCHHLLSRRTARRPGLRCCLRTGRSHGIGVRGCPAFSRGAEPRPHCQIF